MVLNAQVLNQNLKKELLETFDDIDLSLIKNVLYLNSWVSYEESGGILIFTGIDDSIQYAEFGYCVMSETHDNPFEPCETDLDEALEMAKQMESLVNRDWL